MRLTERFVIHLRFDLARQGRTREAIGLIDRILRHRRLSRLVFTHPLSGKLPLLLVWYRQDVTDEELDRIIRRTMPEMCVYGQYQAEWALHRLGNPEAPARAWAMLSASEAR